MRSLFARRRSRLALGVAVALALSLPPGAVATSAAAPGPDPITITQNYSAAVTEGSVNCPSGTTWLRRFDLATDHASTDGFHLAHVVLGHEHVLPDGESMTIYVEAYALDTGAPFVLANLAPLAATSLQVAPAHNLTTSSVDLMASVPAGRDLVIAIIDPGTQGQYWVGANMQPQSRDAYIVGPGCSIHEPVPAATYADGSLMFYAVGTSQDCLTAQAAVTEAEQALAVAKAAYVKAKKTTKKLKKKYKKAKRKAAKNPRYKKKYKKAKKKYKRAARASSKAAGRLFFAEMTLAEARASAEAECAQPSLPEPPPRHRP